MRVRTGILMAGIGAAFVASGIRNALRGRAARASVRPTLDGLSAPCDAPTIVVLGAGFAGVSAAIELARLLPRASDARIVLIDETGFQLFTPMLTEVVGGKIDPHDVARSLRDLSPRITFLQARVERVDLSQKQVDVRVGADIHSVPPARRSIKADQLVLALGSVANFHHIPGLEDHALTIKSVSDAGAIYDHTFALLERADAEPDNALRRALLTFVVGGGGFSGVETMAALNGLVRSLTPTYPGIRPDDIRMLLVHPDERLLPELGPRLAAYAQHELESRGVEIMLNTKIDGAGDGTVRVRGGSTVLTHTLIWTAGVTPNPIVRDLPCRHGKHHGVVTDSALRVPDFTGIWAVGDCAEIPRAGANNANDTYAATAQNATREGKQVARNIVASMRSGAVQPLVYHPIGELAIVGDRAGVADIYGVRLAGFTAWLLWRAVYVSKEQTFAQRLRTALDWLLDLAGPRTLPAFPGHGPSHPAAERAAARQQSGEAASASSTNSEQHPVGGASTRG